MHTHTHTSLLHCQCLSVAHLGAPTHTCLPSVDFAAHASLLSVHLHCFIFFSLPNHDAPLFSFCSYFLFFTKLSHRSFFFLISSLLLWSGHKVPSLSARNMHKHEVCTRLLDLATALWLLCVCVFALVHVPLCGKITSHCDTVTEALVFVFVSLVRVRISLALDSHTGWNHNPTKLQLGIFHRIKWILRRLFLWVTVFRGL